MKQLHVRLTFIDEVLGTGSGDPKIHEQFIASQAPDAPSKEEEIEAIGIDAAVEKGKTVFPRFKRGEHAGEPLIWSYQIKGYFKNQQKAINGLPNEKSVPTPAEAEPDANPETEQGEAAAKPKKKAAKKTQRGKFYLPTYKTKIDDYIFIQRKATLFQMPEGAVVGDCQRPLRAETAQGPRVALANSEALPAGTMLDFTVIIKEDSLLPNVRRWLDMGAQNGLNQWHNSGKGSFLWEELDDEGNVIGGTILPEHYHEVTGDTVDDLIEEMSAILSDDEWGYIEPLIAKLDAYLEQA